MNAFTDAAGSLHGCLMIDSKVVVTTPEWLSLANKEQILLCHLVNSLPPVAAGRDIPVYLPSTSPNVCSGHSQCLWNLINRALPVIIITVVVVVVVVVVVMYYDISCYCCALAYRLLRDLSLSL